MKTEDFVYSFVYPTIIMIVSLFGIHVSISFVMILLFMINYLAWTGVLMKGIHFQYFSK